MSLTIFRKKYSIYQMETDKFVKIVFIFALLTISLSFSYYFVVFLPEKEENRRQEIISRDEQNRRNDLFEKIEKVETNSLLQQCLDTINQRSPEVLKNSSDMTNEKIKIILNLIENQKEECYKRYLQ